jgi:hypothetical protein
MKFLGEIKSSSREKLMILISLEKFFGEVS